ncbi:N-acetyltransferase [Robertmurraya massiliosenegalensis]|uniref:GNAT family N-acetyltransferase n=1 Tax=Robertmurraya TaxID=2837507 RepID=UPI0039A47597
MIEIRRILELDEVAIFMEKMNAQPSHHVGYCGTDKDEIKHTLLTDFSDLSLEYSLMGAFLDDQLVGFIGLDIDKDSKEAEVWGPFIFHSEWDEIADQMWRKLIEELPFSLVTVYGFYNIHNTKGNQFMKRIGAKKSGEHSILQVSVNNLISMKDSQLNIREIEETDFLPFQTLHNDAFPEAYFSADEMIERQGRTQKLFIAEMNDLFCGYVFCEAEPSFAEGDIHFIAVSPAFRNRGVGSELMKVGLNFLFSFKEIEVITLTVKSDNQAALKVYLHAGFTEQHRLYAYRCTFDRRS